MTEMKKQSARPMAISPLWFQFSILTFIIGFTILGYLANSIVHKHPPIPNSVIDENGSILFTGNEIMKGQHLFQKYGLMQYGTIFGHGAYMGPDFTAQYLHEEALMMQKFYARGLQVSPDVEARVLQELKNNSYNPQSKILTYTMGQSNFFSAQRSYYQEWFGPLITQKGLKRPHIQDTNEIHALTSFFSWAAWTSAALRPGTDYSYTNNWPPDALAGNYPTAQAFFWSVMSLIALLGGAGLVFFAFGHYDILGWHRSQEEPGERSIVFHTPEKVALFPVQSATAWYFLVVAGLFLAQGLLGGVNAHYHAEPSAFYGFNIAQLLPYNLSRMWHVQLALFFVTTSFLAMGIFLTPLITGSQPKHQEKLAIALFGAVILVVIGSLLGEAASIQNVISLSGPWFWIGAQGWEYLDLGRLWQILLTFGMIVWVAILFRGIRPGLQGEHPGNLPYLFLYSSLSIPVFYSAGMIFGKNVNFAVMDYWRFWVVHLWVEDFLELFTTIMVAYMFVLLGVIHEKTATRVVYFDIILYSVGGVVGTMHHLYFSGAPAVHMSLGAFFSAMEVIPLLLLTVEAWRFMQLGKWRNITTQLEPFPHHWAVMFLIAVGFWNFLGAGIFGFLINLPIVSYYEIGTAFTANHAHGALMGVYGMLAIGFFMFVARYFIIPSPSSELAMKVAFWSLNIGLGWMLFSNLAPIGAAQLFDSFQNGYWHARNPEFHSLPIIHFIEWLRLPGDLLFIIGGILPVVYLSIRMFIVRKRAVQRIEGESNEGFVRISSHDH
jgi:nitric oxide reductase subunit B